MERQEEAELALVDVPEAGGDVLVEEHIGQLPVLVVGLPSIQVAQKPPLRPADANEVACLLKPKVVLPIEGAPSTQRVYETVCAVLARTGLAPEQVLARVIALESFIYGSAYDVDAPADIFEVAGAQERLKPTFAKDRPSYSFVATRPRTSSRESPVVSCAAAGPWRPAPLRRTGRRGSRSRWPRPPCR